MTFVPTPHTTSGVQVSPRARDLARALETAVEEYRARNPQLSDTEIRQALMLMSRSRSPMGPALLTGMVVAGLVVMGVVVFMMMQDGDAGGGGLQWVAVVAGVLAALLGITVAAGRRGRGGP